MRSPSYGSGSMSELHKETTMTGLKNTVSALPKRRAAEPVESEPVDQSGNKVKRQTLYLPFGVHDQLREAAFSKRISQQEIVRAALDLWFAQEGMPSWDEAK